MLSHDKQGAREANANRLAKIKARASAAAVAASGGTFFVTAGGVGQPATPVGIGNTPTLILTATFTPKTSTNIHVRVNWKVTSDGTGGLSVRNPSSGAQPLNIPAVATTQATRTDDFFVVGVIGTPLTIDYELQGSVGAPGHLTIAAGGASMIVEEAP